MSEKLMAAIGAALSGGVDAFRDMRKSLEESALRKRSLQQQGKDQELDNLIKQLRAQRLQQELELAPKREERLARQGQAGLLANELARLRSEIEDVTKKARPLAIRELRTMVPAEAREFLAKYVDPSQPVQNYDDILKRFYADYPEVLKPEPQVHEATFKEAMARSMQTGGDAFKIYMDMAEEAKAAEEALRRYRRLKKFESSIQLLAKSRKQASQTLPKTLEEKRARLEELQARLQQIMGGIEAQQQPVTSRMPGPMQTPVQEELLDPDTMAQLPQGEGATATDRNLLGEAALNFRIVQGLEPGATEEDMLRAFSWFHKHFGTRIPADMEMWTSGIGGQPPVTETLMGPEGPAAPTIAPVRGPLDLPMPPVPSVPVPTGPASPEPAPRSVHEQAEQPEPDPVAYLEALLKSIGEDPESLKAQRKEMDQILEALREAIEEDKPMSRVLEAEPLFPKPKKKRRHDEDAKKRKESKKKEKPGDRPRTVERIMDKDAEMLIRDLLKILGMGNRSIRAEAVPPKKR